MSQRHQRGFTLVEVTIAVAIIALVAAISIPMISSLSRADLRTAAGKTTGLIRSTYDSAALSGGTTRLIVNLDKGTIMPEAMGKIAPVGIGEEQPDGEDNTSGKGLSKQKQKEKEKEEEEAEPKTDKQLALESLSQLAGTLGFGPPREEGNTGFAAAGDGYTLPDDVRITGFWAQHLKEEQRNGKGYLYFFALGYTEHAILFLTDDSGHTFSLEISALTGRCVIHNDRIQIPSH
jgi:general secretion pathway protein H